MQIVTFRIAFKVYNDTNNAAFKWVLNSLSLIQRLLTYI